jgi:hypothetical protein
VNYLPTNREAARAESPLESERIEMELISIEHIEEPIIPEKPSGKPEYIIRNLIIEPYSIEIGRTVIISLKVSNTGDVSTRAECYKGENFFFSFDESY